MCNFEIVIDGHFLIIIIKLHYFLGGKIYVKIIHNSKGQACKRLHQNHWEIFKEQRKLNHQHLELSAQGSGKNQEV